MNDMNTSNQSYASNCGLFWVANSIVSTVLGAKGRNLQEEAMQRNLDFQRELEEARNIAQDEMEAEKIAFKRRMMKLSRQYRQEQSANVFDQQLKAIEFESFIKSYWPLNKALPHIFSEEIKRTQYADTPLKLNAILLHAPILPYRETIVATKAHIKDSEIYREIERKLENCLKCLGDVDLHRDSCDTTDFIGGNTNLMNIHFLMSALPTLVISPKYNNGKMHFSAAVWEAQASRPLIRPLFTINYNPQLAEQDENYCKQSVEKLETIFAVIIGATRDSYMMLTQGKEPLLAQLLSDRQKNIIASDEILKTFIKNEYNNITVALNEKLSPNILDIYSEIEIDHIKKQAINVQSNILSK